MLSLVDSAGRVRRSELTMSDVEALAAACAGGHVDKVEALLAKGADPNAEDAVFGTPLVAASRGGFASCVALLLARDADCDRRSQRDTPLTAAVSAGHVDVAKLLLESNRCDLSLPQGEDDAIVTPGAMAKNKTKNSRSKTSKNETRVDPANRGSVQTDDPLTLASKRGDLDAVNLLLQHGASPDGGEEGTCDTPLVAAAAGGFSEIVLRLINAGAKIDGVARWAGRTALVAAAESEATGASECCNKLLQKGANANFVSAGVVGRRLGYGAVHAAAARMDCDLVRALVAAGADPNRRARNTDVENVRSRRAAAARALWGAEGAVERLDNTPLHLAVAAYINEAAKRRVAENQNKTDENSEDGKKAKHGDSGVTQETNTTSDLAGSGVSGGVPGDGEKSALEVIKTLLECGADHGAFVVDSTPLHMAALGGACDVVDVLMEAGADANARAPNGYTTPLEAAARYAADILLDRQDERINRAYRRRQSSYARHDSDGLDVLSNGDFDDSENEYTDDDRSYDDRYTDDGWYDDDSDNSQTNYPYGKNGRRGDAFRDGRSRNRGNNGNTRGASSDSYDSGDSSDDSFYGNSHDDDAAMAALRDAEGPLRAARHLVSKWGASVTPHALVGACRAGDENTVFALLEACHKAHEEDGKSLNPKDLVKTVARNTTALHAAAESGSVPIAKAILEKGSLVDHRRPDDDATPLFVAARAGRPGMIAFLFSKGADIEALCKTADRREGHDTVTPLVEAVMSDQAAAAARLIALGADVKAPNSWMPPLLTATLRSNATITRMLLKEGADPRVGVGGMTPLGLAVMTRQSDLVHALLDWRGDENIAGDSDGDESQSKKPRKMIADDKTTGDDDDDDDDNDPLSLPYGGGIPGPDEDPEVIKAARARALANRAKALVGKSKKKKGVKNFRVDPDEPIDAAVLDDGDPEMSSACQCPVCQRRGKDGEGRDPSQCQPIDRANSLNGNGGAYGAERHLTPLAAAAKLDDAETVRALLAAGANPERASGGMPPLAHAAGKGSCAAIVALLEGGAVLESPASLPLTPRDGRTLTPLGVASEAGELSAVELLLERGADPNGPPDAGFEPPLCCAVTDPPDDEEGNPVVGVVRALVAAGADPNASKEDAQSPYSPLMVAAGAGSVAVVRELLEGGADLEHVVRVTVGDSGGPRGGPDRKCHITALLHAAYCNELDAVRFLLLQGAKLGSADREAMSLVCDHLRSKASVGVPDASATLSLLRHQADAEADEEDEKAEQRLREERARAAELKEERKRARKQDAANAEQEAIKMKELEAQKQVEEEIAEAERLAAKVRKQEEYKKEQEARKKEAAAKRAEVKAEKERKKAAAEAEAAAEKAEQQKVLDEVQAMVADLEIKRKAEEAKKEEIEKREREKVIKEELLKEQKEKELEQKELEKKRKKEEKERLKREKESGAGEKSANDTATLKPDKPSTKAAAALAATSAAATKAHLLARDEAEGFTGPATKVTKEDQAEAGSWAQPAGFFVFLCNDSTEEECYDRALMGAPAKFWDNTVDHVKPGTTLILYNFAARTLTGPYEATSNPKWNEHADAWQGGRGAPPGKRLVSAFPVQVQIGASPIMEPVTALLGGDFKPSVGGLPLGSPDQTRRDIIVTKLRNAAKEQGKAAPTASERRRNVSLAKAKAAGPTATASKKTNPVDDKPMGWAATAAGTTSAATAASEPSQAPQTSKQSLKSEKNKKENSPAANAPETSSTAEKLLSKKEKKAAARKALKDAKNTSNPANSAAAGSPEGTASGKSKSSPDAITKTEDTSSRAANAVAAQALPSQSAYQDQGYLGGLAASAAPIASTQAPRGIGGASIGAAPIGGGIDGSQTNQTNNPYGGGYASNATSNAFGASNAYGGAFASAGGFSGLGGGAGLGSGGGGVALGGLSGGLGNGTTGGWNPLGGGGAFGGGGFGGSSSLGGGTYGTSSQQSQQITGGLFSGGGGIFAAPSSNPYAQTGSVNGTQSSAQHNAQGNPVDNYAQGGAPPGYNGGAFGNSGLNANRQQQENNANDERPSFAQAEQLFPWLS